MTDADNDIKKIQQRIKESLLLIFTSESDDASDKIWLIENTSNDRLKQLIPKLSVLSLHTLEIISQNEGIKGIDIAQKLGVTKGAISKVTRKLLDYGLIRKEQRPTNLKEIYFYVTPLGAELSKLHQQYHLELDKKSFELFRSYDLSSLELVADFLEKLARLR
ncbi:MarR family transcriptional regulator [Thermaerobacillus caldiproteolyticus]|uniref:DNA-binding MarR family transcriptional regulator n=1 Tax=Thermaerobacillus caldiproteolyticus TaxID=247480 RepID=A0A7W0BYZ6_9BACL|nr:MarR family transcriptional regulator [Anoxybacillus caldiproteolyticus]MBA2876231.1 DNA-binding MarR family transcriptional regulator [Anoxybacillus caldiproteolyticus]